jgi:hypothetical protein
MRVLKGRKKNKVASHSPKRHHVSSNSQLSIIKKKELMFDYNEEREDFKYIKKIV